MPSFICCHCHIAALADFCCLHQSPSAHQFCSPAPTDLPRFHAIPSPKSSSPSLSGCSLTSRSPSTRSSPPLLRNPLSLPLSSHLELHKSSACNGKLQQWLCATLSPAFICIRIFDIIFTVAMFRLTYSNVDNSEGFRVLSMGVGSAVVSSVLRKYAVRGINVVFLNHIFRGIRLLIRRLPFKLLNVWIM